MPAQTSAQAVRRCQAATEFLSLDPLKRTHNSIHEVARVTVGVGIHNRVRTAHVRAEHMYSTYPEIHQKNFNTFLLSPFYGPLMYNSPSYDKAMCAFCSDSEETFHISPTLCGSYNGVEVISPSRGKGKGNHCAIPACYLVLNGVTIQTASPCECKVSVLVNCK